MNPLLNKVQQHAKQQATSLALASERGTVTYCELNALIQSWQNKLQGSVVGILLDNGPAWIILDLIAQYNDVTCIPLPVFFSPEQLQHIIKTAGITQLITDQPELINECIEQPDSNLGELIGQTLYSFQLTRSTNAKNNISKITFTSGTTGTPKGVCLTADSLYQVAQSLAIAGQATTQERMVSLLPLATLLENIAVYAALIAGGCAHLPSLANVGVSMSGLDIEQLCQTLTATQPHAVILVPQILRALIQAIHTGWKAPTTLRFIAVGGAAVAPSVLAEAKQLGLPVYQGYGLSEAASVVCLNTVQANRLGSVGKPLPHVSIKLTNEGEVLVKGALFTGYLGQQQPVDEYWPTGDLGYLDEQGYLYLQGRKSNIIISSYGRNISPEWIETELMGHPAITQAVMFGDGKPYNVALIIAADNASAQTVAQAINASNQRLPNYARINKYYICDRAFDPQQGELTSNGRPCRTVIYQHYQTIIEPLYQEFPMPFYDELVAATENERQQFLQIPAVIRGLKGNISLESYIAFLTQAYYHVRHTVPLLMACGGRLSQSQEWLRVAIAEYIEEETGHQEWILNDIKAAGGDAEAVRNGTPDFSTEMMVAYAYDIIYRNNPVGFFGMVLVLEGMSVALASNAAAAVQQNLQLSDTAFSYLTSHGALDQDHIQFFESLMNQLDSDQDKQTIIHTARCFYRLYGDIFRALPLDDEDDHNHQIMKQNAKEIA